MWNGDIRLAKPVYLVLTSLLICLLPLLTAGVRPVQAQTSCSYGAALELAYDDGVAMGQAKTGLGGCPSCTVWQGVSFSLPTGLSSAILTATRVYAGTGKGSLKVYVTDASKTVLEQPVAFKVNGTAWYSVTLPNIVVEDGFWIWVERQGGSFFEGAVEPFYDSERSGPSKAGDSPSDKILTDAPGDFMIRAQIVPEVHVGPGRDYETIQEAVDAVWDGWTIVVHDGQYNQSVTVDKSVVIKSLSGPDRTIIQVPPSAAESDVFRITASCVRLSGFTIQGADYVGRAGVYIDDSDGCVISGNVIRNNTYGIYVSQGSSGNILLENECSSNANGIYVDGSENYISGNHLHGNTALVGSAVYLAAFGSSNQLRFNSITLDAAVDPAVAAGAQVCNQNSNEEASAIENWWGTETGPANAGGQGPVVGEGVRYYPWLGKQPVRVTTAAAWAGAYSLDSRTDTSVLVIKEGPGTAFLSVARFAENPVGEFRYKSIDKWIDVLLSSSQGIDGIQARVYYSADELAASGLKEGSLRLFWWNGQKWQKCSKTGVDKNNDFVWAQFNLKSKPSASDLSGTMFAVGVPKSSFAWWLIPVIVVIVLLLLIVVRLAWVLVARRGAGYTSID